MYLISTTNSKGQIKNGIIVNRRRQMVNNKKYLLVFVFIMAILCGRIAHAQPIERVIKSLPVFVAYTYVQAVDSILTVGVFSDVEPEVPADILEKFRNLRAWNQKAVQKVTGHKKVVVVSLNANNIDEFSGQIIWVLAASDSLAKIEKQTVNGVLTIGSNEKAYEDHLLLTLTFKNVSKQRSVQRWRLSRFYANCALSPLRFNESLMNKKYFVGNGCNDK